VKSITLKKAEQIVEELEYHLRKELELAPIEEEDAKIKPLVIGLVRWKINTTSCCQGHLDRGFGYPWVRVSEESLGRVNEILMCWTRRRAESSVKWIIEPAYQPMIRPEEEDLGLKIYHKEIKEFGDWLQGLPSNYFCED